MATVFLDGPNNSTLFTTCCDVAILDHQGNCPQCGQDVQPKTRTERWETAYGPIRRKVRWYGNWYPNHGEGRKRGMSSNQSLDGRKERQEP